MVNMDSPALFKYYQGLFKSASDKPTNVCEANQQRYGTTILINENNWRSITDFGRCFQQRMFKVWCLVANCLERTPTEISNDPTAIIAFPESKPTVSYFLEVISKHKVHCLIAFGSLAAVILASRVIKRKPNNGSLDQEAFLKEINSIKLTQESLKQQLVEIRNSPDERFDHFCNNINCTVSQLEDELLIMRNELEKLLEENARPIDLQEAQTENMAENQDGRMDPEVVKVFEIIAGINSKTQDFEKRILCFNGTEHDKDFLNIRELLVRNIIKLDYIESKGNADIRNRRREAVEYINTCLIMLEDRVRQK